MSVRRNLFELGCLVGKVLLGVWLFRYAYGLGVAPGENWLLWAAMLYWVETWYRWFWYMAKRLGM
jgi:hypothetical protein